MWNFRIHLWLILKVKSLQTPMETINSLVQQMVRASSLPVSVHILPHVLMFCGSGAGGGWGGVIVWAFVRGRTPPPPPRHKLLSLCVFSHFAVETLEGFLTVDSKFSKCGRRRRESNASDHVFYDINIFDNRQKSTEASPFEIQCGH